MSENLVNEAEILKAFEDETLYPIIKPNITEFLYMGEKLKLYKAELDKILDEGIKSSNKEKYSFFNKLYLDTEAKFNTASQMLLRYASKSEGEEESPLRAFLKGLQK